MLSTGWLCWSQLYRCDHAARDASARGQIANGEWDDVDCPIPRYNWHCLSHGGAGIRTPVRDTIDYSVYVRSPPIEVFSCWPVGGPPLNKSSEPLPNAGRRSAELSRICDTHQVASGGLPGRQVRQPKLRSQGQVRVGSCSVSRGIIQDPRTWARGHSFTYPVEASRPRDRQCSATGAARQW